MAGISQLLRFRNELRQELHELAQKDEVLSRIWADLHNEQEMVNRQELMDKIDAQNMEVLARMDEIDGALRKINRKIQKASKAP